jgi:excisionase family DNA binding protein
MPTNPPRPLSTLRFLSLKEAGERLDVSVKSIRRWIAKGDLRVHRFGHQHRISEDDFWVFVASRRRSTDVH